MKAEEFDRKFDQGGEDIIDDLDVSTARRINQEQKRINVDFPAWVVESLDREAARIGVTRQSIIKVWLVERLKAEASNKPAAYLIPAESYEALMDTFKDYELAKIIEARRGDKPELPALNTQKESNT